MRSMLSGALKVNRFIIIGNCMADFLKCCRLNSKARLSHIKFLHAALGQWVKIVTICFTFLLLSCTTQVEQNVLNQDDVFLVDSLASNKICFHRNMSLVHPSDYPSIINSIKTGIDTTDRIVEFRDVEFRVLVFPERTIPRIGMSGAAPDDKHIYILLDPDHPKFYEAITTHIIETIPHEYHHTLRNRAVGYGRNLFESMVSEGLASHFAMEVCSIDTPGYCIALNIEQFIEWKHKAQQIWFEEEFDHLEWFVGLRKEIPKNAGYTIGFSIVSNYLQKHPQESAASLYATVADEFLEVEKNNQ